MKRIDELHDMIAVPTAHCILWPYATSAGYADLKIDGRQRRGHSYVCELTYGARPDRMVAAHLCGSRRCINPAHLRWATPKENQHDRDVHGRTARGERQGNSRLTTLQVCEMRHLRDAGWHVDALGERFGITASYVYDVTTRRSWKWLEAAS